MSGIDLRDVEEFRFFNCEDAALKVLMSVRPSVDNWYEIHNYFLVP